MYNSNDSNQFNSTSRFDIQEYVNSKKNLFDIL